MANPLSTIGIILTIISVAPVVAGFYSFWRYKKILPSTGAGLVYIVTLIASLLSSFTLSKTGLANPVIIIGTLSILLALGGWLVIPRLSFLGGLRPYLSALGLDLSFLLLGIPAINETLSRLPPSNPIEAGPTSAPVQNTILGWAVIWAIGVLLQMWHIHASSKSRAWR